MYDKECSAKDGTIESANMTVAQKNYAEILSHLARVAKYVEMRNMNMWVEKPNGYQLMLDQLAKDGKAYDNLTPNEREEYEKKFRYEKITSQRLGGSQILLQHMIFEAHQDEEIKKLWKAFLDDVKLIASKETVEYFDRRDDETLR